jgi:endoglucanase
MKRRAALLTGSLIAVTPMAAAVPTAQAAIACSVQYSVANQWPGGFQGNIVIKNLGDTLSSWSLTFTFTNGQTVTQGWGGRFTTGSSSVTVTNEVWNGSLASNASTNPGFIGSWNTTTNSAPASFSLNGTVCNGSQPTTTTSATTQPTTTSATTQPTTTSATQTSNSGAAPALHVSGNSGASYRLLGVNRSGGEFACIQGNGMWNGPMDQASITAMRTWKIRAVRVPLNEECWVGTSDVPAGQPSGATYQQNVKDYVNLLISNGITPILEMHWSYGTYTGTSSGCSDVKATCQKPMPDAQYAPTFWTGVANAFKGNDAVMFDLFNEPYPERATGDATSGWKCWRDGGTCPGIPYQVAGFQSLVNAVRATGATNVIMVGGLAYSNDASQMLTYLPNDPNKNIMGFGHIYNFNSCSNTSCYDSTFGQVAKTIPFALTEIGENTCGRSFIDTIMNWADANGIGYLGWTWNNWDCSTGPSLISDYTGTPTAFGQGLKDHLALVSN